MAYHSQTDDQFKHINQMIEITLHYFLILNSDKVYTTVLPYLQDSLNNSWNSSTDYALNKLAYGFQTNNTLNNLIDVVSEEYNKLHQIYHKEVEQSIVFTNATSKSYYDSNHTSLTLDSMIYL